MSSPPITETCWYHKFLADPCDKPGLYGKPSSESVFVRESRWCDAHKHEDDVLIAVLQEVSE